MLIKQDIVVPNIGEIRHRGVGNNGMGQMLTEAYVNKHEIYLLIATRLTLCIMWQWICDAMMKLLYGPTYMEKFFWVYLIALIYICCPLRHLRDHIVFYENGFIFNGTSYNFFELGRMHWLEESPPLIGRRHALFLGGRGVNTSFLWQVRNQHHRAYNVEDNFLYTLPAFIKVRDNIDSREKKEIAQIVRQRVPDDAEYTPLYAYWYETSPRSYKCEYYAIGFSNEKLYVTPVTYVKRKAKAAPDTFIIEKKNLGRIETLRDCGPVNRMVFYDRNYKKILSIWVERSNIKLDSCNPVNIRQRDEAMSFINMICRQWKEEVN